MESWKVLLLVMVSVFLRKGEGQLMENFYEFSCPNVEPIVREVVIRKMVLIPTAPATLRLFLHDCFIEGCDGSIMIASPNNDAEKDAGENLSLAGDGFDTIMKAKEAVEMQCPGIVSCADIIAIAARDVVELSHGPRFNVELGRRDGLISQKSRVPGKIPGPDFNLAQLNQLFNKHNLSQTDMIALSGAHTIGVSHCSRFAKRLYAFSNTSEVDPSLDKGYAEVLKGACPPNVDPSISPPLEYQDHTTFNNQYYQNLIDHKGLLTSDEVLFIDPASQDTVRYFANDQLEFYKAFVTGMIKLGRVDVKTGDQGEIRRNCAAFNA